MNLKPEVLKLTSLGSGLKPKRICRNGHVGALQDARGCCVVCTNLRYARYRKTEKRRMAAFRYRHSTKGKATTDRSNKTERAKQNRKRYQKTEKGKASALRYSRSAIGKAAWRRRCQTDRYKQTVKRAMERYVASGKRLEQSRRRRLRYTEEDRAKRAQRERLRQARKKKAIVATLYTPQQRRERFGLFNNACAYCGASGKLTDDHAIALANDGAHDISNILPACHRCNCSKYTKHPSVWYPQQPFYTKERWERILTHAPHVSQ